MKIFNRKILSFILVLMLIFNLSIVSFANESQLESLNTTNNVIQTDDGIYINNIFYSKTEFEALLDKAVPIESDKNGIVQPRSATALVAGTWYIPVVGKVVITAAGVVIIGGAVIKAGSWAYNKVVNWFEAKAEKENYEEDRDAGRKTDNHERVEGESSLPHEDEEPYSSKDLIDDDGVKQRRYYDEDGNADVDIDYHHSDNGEHTFPHRHYWNNGVRGGDQPF